MAAMASERTFPGKVGLQQRVLPAYRRPFFEKLAAVCEGGLSVFAGEPRGEEAVITADHLEGAQWITAGNLHLFRDPYYLCWQRGLFSWLKWLDPDVLILEANPRYLVNWGGLTWMHRRGKPVVGWGLGAPTIQGPLAGVRERARRSFLRRFDALLAYSSVGAEQYVSSGLSPERVFVAPNAVTASAPPLRDRAPVSTPPLSLLYVGRLQERKRVDLLLRACGALEGRLRPTVVGDGPARKGLERLAAEVCPGAEFVGAVWGEELKPFFHQADLFVLPGTGGLAVQEAMAHGLPVIVAEGDGTQRDLVSGDNGWLVPSDDLGALIEALREALSQPARLRSMGRASHRLVAERFNLTVMVSAFVQALRAVWEGR